MEKLDFTDHGMVISAEDAADPAKYRRAKAIAAEAGQTLRMAPPVPKPWQPPADSYVVRHDVTTEEYQDATKAAQAQGLKVVIAPEGFRGPAVQMPHGSVWEPPVGAIVISSGISQADWLRAMEAAARLGTTVVMAPDSANVPAKLPEKITPGLPIIIPRDASPSEYRRLKKLAEERRVPYQVVGQ